MPAPQKTAAAKALGLLLFCAPAILDAQFIVQPLGDVTCSMSAVPTSIRAGGLAERAGDIRLDCENDGRFNAANPGLNHFQQYLPANFRLQLSVPVANRIDVGEAGFTDAVLVVNRNNHFSPQAASVLPGAAGSGDCLPDGGFPDPRYPCPQKGVLLGSRALVWDGVRVPIPGAPNDLGTLPPLNADSLPECEGSAATGAASCFSITTTLRFTNVRVNATGSPGAGVRASLTIDPFASIAIVGSRQAAVADAFTGLRAEVTEAASGLQCNDGPQHATLTLQEGFASAFRVLGEPTVLQAGSAVENGYPVQMLDGAEIVPQTNAGTGGGATQATRFLLRFAEIPAGVGVEVPRLINNDLDETGCEADPTMELCLRIVADASPDGGGGAVNLGDSASGIYSVPVSGGAGFAVYEVNDSDPFRRERIDVPVWFDWLAAGGDLPAPASGTVEVHFAPLNGEAGASNEPVPRFTGGGADSPATVITVARCTTTLLFPFVSNRTGFDTAIAISNTSTDWKGTGSQRGSCRVHYVGTTGASGPMPPDDQSFVVESGETMVFTLSGGGATWNLRAAPNFQGFVVATCDFQFAHGYAFLSSGGLGLPVWAQGYLGLVLAFDREGNRVVNGGKNPYAEALGN